MHACIWGYVSIHACIQYEWVCFVCAPLPNCACQGCPLIVSVSFIYISWLHLLLLWLPRVQVGWCKWDWWHPVCKSCLVCLIGISHITLSNKYLSIHNRPLFDQTDLKRRSHEIIQRIGNVCSSTIQGLCFRETQCASFIYMHADHCSHNIAYCNAHVHYHPTTYVVKHVCKIHMWYVMPTTTITTQEATRQIHIV